MPLVLLDDVEPVAHGRTREVAAERHPATGLIADVDDQGPGGVSDRAAVADRGGATVDLEALGRRPRECAAAQAEGAGHGDQIDVIGTAVGRHTARSFR